MHSIRVLFFVLVFFIILFWMFAMRDASDKKTGRAIVHSLVAMLQVGFLAVFIGPIAFGFGRIHNKEQSFTDQLNGETAYQVTATSQDGESFVVLVKKFGTSEFRAIRVKKAPPELFTLVDGEPIPITPQPPTK